QNFRRHFRTVFEFAERLEVHNRVFLTERIVEAALRQSTVQRVLTAFEARAYTAAGTCVLTFMTSRRRLTHAAAGAASNALFRVTGARCRLQFVDFHRRTSFV